MYFLINIHCLGSKGFFLHVALSNTAMMGGFGSKQVRLPKRSVSTVESPETHFFSHSRGKKKDDNPEVKITLH